ncbi:MAG: hydantoinase B/oxoprolinase family protein [Rhizobiaceae bacterium]
MNAPLDEIGLQVAWNRLINIVEDQAQKLIRASFSTSVREAGDLSAGIFDLKGRMLAQAVTGTPGHVNSMANAVPHFIAEYPVSGMKPGDALITNDPWITSGHLHDVTIVTPVFLGMEPVALLACTVHLVDVGGRGMGPDAAQVYEEGVQIPIMPLVREGVINRDLMKLVMANTREPKQVEGDLLSCISANEAAAGQLAELLAAGGIELKTLGEEIIERSRAAMLREISCLTPGVFTNGMALDGYEEPIRLEATLTIDGDGIAVDFAGTSPMSARGINVVLNYTSAYATFAVKCAVAPDLPNNYGSMSAIRISAPAGCILHAVYPAPVSARHVVGHAVPDVVLGCFARMAGSAIPAEAGMMWNPMLRGATGLDGEVRNWEIFLNHSGGMGARPGGDGLSATAFPAGVKATPVEVAEANVPLIYWRKELRADSGGAGRFRGGLGQTIEIGGLRDGPIAIQAMFDRISVPANGRSGGGTGAGGIFGTAAGRPLAGKGLHGIGHGERFSMQLPGGGGIGDAFARDPASVAGDVRDGFVSVESARSSYGVAVDPQGNVDERATAVLRRMRCTPELFDEGDLPVAIRHTQARSITEVTPEEHAAYKLFRKANPIPKDNYMGILRMMEFGRGEDRSILPIDNYTHGLQTATRVLRDGGDDEAVVVALLHDCADTVTPMHGEVAAAMLSPYVSEKSVWIIKHHGIFQDYYRQYVSEKVRMGREQFRGHTHFDACVEFCEKYDQVSFDPDYDTLPIETFYPMLDRVFAHTRYFSHEH